MKIAIVAHNRFHAFDLTRELILRGHQVGLFTNYPVWSVRQFGIAAGSVRSFFMHGALDRVAEWCHRKTRIPYPEAALHRLFGRWAARAIRGEHWDVVHSWSGVSEEILHALQGTRTFRWVARGSAHIRTQARILEEEEQRTGMRLDRPSRWILAREEREYALADAIAVPSRFAYRSFLEEGVPAGKLRLLPLGVEVNSFRSDPAVVKDRCRRIRSGEPLRVLYTGALSFQKGLWDMVTILHRLERGCVRFRLIGPIAPEVRRLLAELSSLAELIPRQAQRNLPRWYAWADLFILPTLHDGYGMVLAQAQAGALPILATTNCAGPDLVREGENGWVLSIRAPEEFVERLRWCDRHRDELACMVQRIHRDFVPRDWADVAKGFEALCPAGLSGDKPPRLVP